MQQEPQAEAKKKKNDSKGVISYFQLIFLMLSYNLFILVQMSGYIKVHSQTDEHTLVLPSFPDNCDIVLELRPLCLCSLCQSIMLQSIPFTYYYLCRPDPASNG